MGSSRGGADVNLSAIDLNLLHVVATVLMERSATRAARKLHVTQSAVSNALRRARDVLGDPLVVREPYGLAPTPRAAALLPALQAWLEEARRLVAGPPPFEPATSTRTFTIACSDALAITLLQPLLSVLRRAAPPGVAPAQRGRRGGCLPAEGRPRGRQRAPAPFLRSKPRRETHGTGARAGHVDPCSSGTRPVRLTLPGLDRDIARMSDLDISLDPARLQIDRVHAWLAGSYWSPDIRKEVVVRAFAHSLAAGAYRGTAQVGVARIVTDEATFAWLCDVYVDEAARGRGVARAMVAALLADPRLATIRRCCLATRDAHALYRGLGFVPVPAANWLELRGPAERWQDVPRG